MKFLLQKFIEKMKFHGGYPGGIFEKHEPDSKNI